MHAFKRFNQGLLALPLHLRAWVLLLISVNFVTPFFFLEHVEAQAVLAAGALGVVLMTANEPGGPRPRSPLGAHRSATGSSARADGA